MGTWFSSTLAIAIAFPLFLSSLTLAQVPTSGTLSVTQTCAAPRAINGVNPGNIQINKGQNYSVVGFNSAERRYLLILVPNATPQRRWVSATCGDFSVSASQTPTPRPSSAPSTQAFLPFFDQTNNPEQLGFPRGQKADITPPSPELNEFDRAVLNTCGAFNTPVRAAEFQRLMESHPEVLQRVKQAVGDRNSDAAFLTDLTAIWSNRKGFQHIFCGDIRQSRKANDDIGGLHFVGRYWQLQQQGIGGRLPNNRQKEEVVPGAVYTVGVAIRQGDRLLKDDLKGYPLVSNAEEILIDVTRGAKAQGNTQGACLLSVVDRETQQKFQAVLVKDRNAIVTYYPDATPQGTACKLP